MYEVSDAAGRVLSPSAELHVGHDDGAEDDDLE
jgi:hypothetical protein